MSNIDLRYNQNPCSIYRNGGSLPIIEFSISFINVLTKQKLFRNLEFYVKSLQKCKSHNDRIRSDLGIYLYGKCAFGT